MYSASKNPDDDIIVLLKHERWKHKTPEVFPSIMGLQIFKKIPFQLLDRQTALVTPPGWNTSKLLLLCSPPWGAENGAELILITALLPPSLHFPRVPLSLARARGGLENQNPVSSKIGHGHLTVRDGISQLQWDPGSALPGAPNCALPALPLLTFGGKE